MSPAESGGPRVLLFTGKGGVGKTTVSAGTAVLAARAGRRTLVMSTDAAHSLTDAFGIVHSGGEASEVEPNLWVQQVDAQRRFEQSWGEIQGYLLSVLDAVGVDAITAEELTVIPGAEEVLALLELRNQVRSGRWDVVAVDCAPTAETLRLLALPEALGWYMERIFPVQHRVVRALRPVLTRAAGVPMPGDSVFDAMGFGSSASASSMMSASMSSGVFRELVPDLSLVDEHFDVMAGRWPTFVSGQSASAALNSPSRVPFSTISRSVPTSSP